MAIKAHMDSLNQRHQELEAAISAEIKHPGSDDLRIVELKRKKLKIKDQLREFRTQNNSPN
ncbi:YdcH family protein [Hyphococcus lacteus]|uniref:YdcH family protein n=1 Tax=Hyphococcus lacteus TaxID=3143536 RepID=UPI0034E0B4BA